MKCPNIAKYREMGVVLAPPLFCRLITEKFFFLELYYRIHVLAPQARPRQFHFVELYY